MTTTKQKTTEEFDWKFSDYASSLEKEWRASLLRFTDKELLKIFPETKETIPEKIVEWEEKQKEILGTIKKKLTSIKHSESDEFSKWFWREWVKTNEGETLVKIDNQIARLKGLLVLSKGREPKGRLTEEQIQQALAVPIENLINQPLRKMGRVLVGLCPLHNEKRPSFYVYPETNSCWCYGCNQGGNVINFIKLLHCYSFKEAVQYLIK